MIYITQPTYLPWIGYFGFCKNRVEVVFLDDIQFARRSWQQRNKIMFGEKYRYLTVPVISKGKRDQLIKDVEIYEQNFFENHLKIIENTYKNTPYFQEVFKLLNDLKDQINQLIHLSDINIMIIENICNFLNINLKYSKSSELNISEKRSKKLAGICNKLKIKELMANQGSMEYMTKDKEIFISNNINIIFFKYNIIDYNQPTKKFIKELSILDLLFNEGPNALNIINKGTIQIQN